MYQDELFKNSQQVTIGEVSKDLSEMTSIQKETSTVLEPESNDTSEYTDEIMIGVVTNCTRLNVREEPRADAVVVCEVNCQTELMIDETESTEEFFKVFTSAGMEGFCMNKFITVQP